ncbi:MAG: NADP-dependent phosphogluconate dehydrogenase [Puniceicoccales bacterium]|jgi:6-phosphogluconate dehydrogenase|nr:NADP-dependent phosphogluconate dehydrogenase [Puniceicoccales bacterium]
MTKDTTLSDIGLIGLAVMGQNLALNIADHGFSISVYNRTTAKTHEFLEKNPDTPGALVGHDKLKDFVNSIKRPRKIILLVKAGTGTDAVIAELLPLLDKDDIIIDGGNSLWKDTIRREKELREKDIRFIGSGVSGGEEGARFGPALMPGGDKATYKELEKIWNAIAAKVDKITGKPLLGAAAGKPVKGGVPCATYIGENGAGHYVKMIHNGIEYGDMQMICEAYDLLKNIAEIKPREMSKIFAKWSKGVLNSFLIEITADILNQQDPVTDKPLVDVILDTAGQKGTGKWTSVNALDMGVPAPTIAESVFARCISAVKEERTVASKILKGPSSKKYTGDKNALIQAIHDALYCSKICSYAQGFQLMREAQKEYSWKLNFGKIAQIWRGGCIIRAAFLQKITEAYAANPKLANLLLDPYFNNTIHKAQANWRKVIALAVENGISLPTFSSALAYYDGYRTERLPANLLQAQRDYFGAHTYERIDQKRGKFYHINWLHPDRPQIDC